MSWTIVTGGAKGLGAEICLELAQAGYNVIVHYNQSGVEAQDVVKKCRDKGVKAEAMGADFSTRKGVEKFAVECLERFPKVQNLVYNVGNYLIQPALNTSIEELNDLYQTNLFAPFLLIQKLIPSIKAEKGCIINIGVAGLDKFNADTYSTAYTMTKSGLLLLTKSLAKELASDGVRVNMVSPGYLDNSVDLPNQGKGLPMGRPATSREVAEVVKFLIDKSNSYITGQNIEVAGGVRL